MTKKSNKAAKAHKAKAARNKVASVPEVERRSVFIVFSSPEYETMYNERGFKIVDKIELSDIVQFTGGSDVTPALYGEEPHQLTNSCKVRDEREMLVYAAALRMEKPMVGICRGGQFLNVMNGGKMNQHINGHCCSHNITYEDVDGEMQSVRVSSTHHQHMLHNVELGQVVAVSSGTDAPEGIEEVVYYDYTNCLCFQPHPEMRGYDECQDFFFDAVEAFLFTPDEEEAA